MSSKEVKNALKAAREAIRNKEYKEALKHCKAVLAEDKNNYNALVFVGVAAEGLEEYDQALKAYHRAAEACPDQLLAWQGLSSMHTKNPGQVPREDIVNVYEKLIDLYGSDTDKLEETMKKLIPLYGDRDLDKALSLYDRLAEKKGSGGEGDVVVNIVNRLLSQPSLSPQHEGKLLSCLRSLLTSEMTIGDQGTDTKNHIRSYLLLLQKREPEIVYGECSRLAVRYPSCPFPQKMRLRLLLDRQINESDPDEVEEIRKLTSSLTDLSQGQSSTVLLLARGYLSLREGKFPTARDTLQESVDKMPTSFCAHYYLCVALFRLHATSNYLSMCQQALALQSSKMCEVSVNTSGAVQRLHEMAVRCCLQQGGRILLEQAVIHLKELTEGSGETDILQAYVHLELNDQQQLQTCLEKLENQDSTAVTALRAWVDFHQHRYIDATTKLQQCVGQDPSSSDYLLMLGRVLWERRGEGATVQEQCFNTLLKTAKLDPYLSATFLYLGHFYTQLKKDQQRGKKCYQKAYDLDTSNEEAGAALCDLMAALGEEESVQNLLQKVTDTASAGCAKWAWLRLGLAQVRTGDPTTAITSFQSALRADPTDMHVWECLAEAYLNRGSYTAALKAFTKAVELGPDSIYSLYKLASIKQALGSLREAVEEYNLILNKDAHYVPALKGLGETYLQLTQRYLSRGLLGIAVDTCQQALILLTRSASHRPDLSCLWKLMGDCCTVLHPLHSASFQIRVPGRLCRADSSDSTVVMDKAAFMELGTKCYGRALKMLPDSAPLWHDLGLALFYLCREQTGEQERKGVVERSIRALKKAVTLDPGHYRHWTALGVVSASPYVEDLALAQHCFIKSIQCENNNAVAWTNLGTLYLRSDEIQLAHEAFKVAQSQDPELVGSWVGQALVAETVQHEEAMDLFRHTTLLAIHPESCIGYGHWVVSTLLDIDRQDSEAVQYCIHQMAAIPAATDALTRYTEINKDNTQAFNMLGLLLEHQELYQSALTAFTRASELAEKQGMGQAQQQMIQLNRARLLSQTERYKEAVEVFQTCAQTFEDVCQWAMALYRAGQLHDSYQVYQKALGLAETDRDRSDVWAALGMAAYKTGKRDEAKTALFQSFQLSTPSVEGLLALCALGVLQRDTTLTKATLQELSVLVTKNGGDRLCDFATLTVAFNLSQGDISSALRCVQSLLNDSSPQGAQVTFSFHLLMTRLALQVLQGHMALTSAHAALRSLDLRVKDAMVALTLAQLYMGQHSRQKITDNALRSAQKAFHYRPDDISALCCLAGAVHADAVINFITKGDTGLMVREVSLLNMALTSPKVTATQRSWCLKQKAVTQLMMNDLNGCRCTIKQMQDDGQDSSMLASVLQCVVDNRQSGLEPLILRDGAPLYFWQILVCVLQRGGQWREAGVVVREALQRAQDHSTQVVKVVCLVTMAWLAAKQLMAAPHSRDAEGLLGEVEEACEAVIAISDISYSMTQTLLAQLYLHTNPRKAKHHFANVLEEGHKQSCLGVDVSLARRGILHLLYNSGKDSDQQLVQKLLSEAETSGDLATTQLYKTLAM